MASKSKSKATRKSKGKASKKAQKRRPSSKPLKKSKASKGSKVSNKGFKASNGSKASKTGGATSPSAPSQPQSPTSSTTSSLGSSPVTIPPNVPRLSTDEGIPSLSGTPKFYGNIAGMSDRPSRRRSGSKSSHAEARGTGAKKASLIDLDFGRLGEGITIGSKRPNTRVSGHIVKIGRDGRIQQDAEKTEMHLPGKGGLGSIQSSAERVNDAHPANIIIGLCRATHQKSKNKISAKHMSSIKSVLKAAVKILKKEESIISVSQ